MQPTLDERNDRAVAIVQEARARLFGLSDELALLPEAGDMLGRLFLTGEISRDQYDAGKAYRKLSADYHFANLMKPLGSSSDYNRTGGHDGSDGTDPDYVAWANRIRGRWRTARKALLECGDALAMMVLDGIIEDRPMFEFVGTLRVALNAVARVTQRKEAA